MPLGNQSSFEECSEEGCSKPIVNKKYKLCKRHNWERIHGEDYYEHKKKKQKEYRRNAIKKAKKRENNSGRSKRGGLRKKSTKQRKKDVSIKKAYEKVDDRDGRRCTGCGQRRHLSHSHLVPQSRRKDLRDEPRNIMLQCVLRGDGSIGCHKRYELGRAFELENFDEIMERLKELDETYYELYKQKMKKKRNEKGTSAS